MTAPRLAGAVLAFITGLVLGTVAIADEWDTEATPAPESSRPAASSAERAREADTEQYRPEWFLQDTQEGELRWQQPTLRAARAASRAGATPAASVAGATGLAPPRLYRIQPGDQLAIVAYRIPDLTREVLVRPDGRISYPLIGELRAAGRTVHQLHAALHQRLTRYVRRPEIDVNVTSFGSQQIIVLGEVNAPGVYRFSGTQLSLGEVIALARGYTPRAHLKSVMVVPGNPLTSETVKRVNFHAYLKLHRLAENPLIPGGSLVYVPRSFLGSINQFVDDVAGPAYRIGLSSREVHFAWKEITD